MENIAKFFVQVVRRNGLEKLILKRRVPGLRRRLPLRYVDLMLDGRIENEKKLSRKTICEFTMLETEQTIKKILF